LALSRAKVWLRKGVPAGWLCLALSGTLIGIYTDTLGLTMLSLWVGSFMFMAHWLQSVLLQAQGEQFDDLRRRRKGRCCTGLESALSSRRVPCPRSDCRTASLQMP
jgi:hypothetical protein